MTLSVSGDSITFPDLSTLQTAPSGFGFKNRIINGDMRIDQRNAGAAVTPTVDGTFTLDRFAVLLSQPSKFSIQQKAGAVSLPTGFTGYLGVTSLSAYSVGAGERFALQHVIEGFNVGDMGWGTANAKTFTLSFVVYSSLTGTFGGTVQSGTATRCYAFTYSIPAANTWTTISVTITGDTTAGGWNTNNTSGLILRFGLGVGSSASTAAGVWGAGNFSSATGATSVVGTSGATFYITGVQLEKGSTATAFDYRDYGRELMMCQRYCYLFETTSQNGNFVINTITGQVARLGLPLLLVTMRTTPSITVFNLAGSPGFLTEFSSNANFTVSSLVNVGPSGGGYVQLASSNTNGFYYKALYSAEL
jgi:hypothetical protein